METSQLFPWISFFYPRALEEESTKLPATASWIELDYMDNKVKVTVNFEFTVDLGYTLSTKFQKFMMQQHEADAPITHSRFFPACSIFPGAEFKSGMN